MDKKMFFILIVFLIISLIININLKMTNEELSSNLVDRKTEFNKILENKNNIINKLNDKINKIENDKENNKLLTETLLESLKIKSKQKKVNYFYGEATAYHPPSGGINSDNNPEITSIGLKAEEGIIAVNPNMIPYGSEVMIITGNKVIRGIAGDTGSAMMKNPKQVDILMSSLKKAKEFGRRKVHILYW